MQTTEQLLTEDNFDQKVDRVLVLFKIIQKSLTFETELRFLDKPTKEFKKHRKNGWVKIKQKYKEVVKIDLLKTQKFVHDDENQFIKIVFFSLYVKQDFEGKIITKFSANCYPMDKEIRKLWDLLHEAQNS